MNSINLRIDNNSIDYNIEIGSDILDISLKDLYTNKTYNKVLIIYDSNIESSYIQTIHSISSGYISSVEKISLDVNINIKSIDSYKNICEYLIKNNYTRDSLIISCGGGSIGDLSGFVASTYYRGIDYIQIPSTLLSMVDSSVGGKTGIDSIYGKNLIGTFYHPVRVIIDTNLLSTLKLNEIHSGLFEVIKYSILFSNNFFSYLEDNINDTDKITNLTYIISECCRMKSNVVSNDERDNSQRLKLNFGHTIGHAIESAYGLSHGESVGLGMKCAINISQELGFIDPIKTKRIFKLINKLNLSKIQIDSELILKKLKKDKKMENNQNTFILIKDIEHSFVYNKVGSDIIKTSIKNL